MKLSTLATACIALAATGAHAQSSVTLFGLIDTGVARYSGEGGARRALVTGDAYQSSRLGFRGVEDLGGGLKAGFHLEAAIAPDTGAGGSTNTNNQSSGNAGGGLTFGRRSTVSLMGGWGEVRLGRDYVPGFHNLSTFSAFGTNGVGSSGHLFYPVQSAARITNVRASNSIGYLLPSIGGLYGQAMVAFGENPSNAGATEDDGQVLGLRLGYAAGPFNVAAATTRTRISALGDLRQTNLGASYDFGVVKPMLLWGENRVGATRARAVMLSATAPVGASGQVRVAYARVNTTGVGNDASQWAAGYVNNLSKRTAVYAQYGRVSNQSGTNYHVGQAPGVAGGASSGLEAGIRHSF
jgi:predicted porin